MKTLRVTISIIAFALTGCAHTGYQRDYVGYDTGYSVQRYYDTGAHSYYRPAPSFSYQEHYRAPRHDHERRDHRDHEYEHHQDRHRSEPRFSHHEDRHVNWQSRNEGRVQPREHSHDRQSWSDAGQRNNRHEHRGGDDRKDRGRHGGHDQR